MEFVGITQAAEILQTTPKTLKLWLDSETFPAQIKPILIGRRFKFNKKALEQYINI